MGIRSSLELLIGRGSTQPISSLMPVPPAPVAAPSEINYLYNSDLELWDTFASPNRPIGWQLVGGAIPVQNTSLVKLGTKSLALARTTGTPQVVQNAATGQRPVGWWAGRTVTFGCWVLATAAGGARLGLTDGIGTTNSAYHNGNSAWQFLTVTRTLDASATKVEVQLQVDTVATTAYFDGAILVFGSSVLDWAPSNWQGRRAILYFSVGNANGTLGGGPEYFGLVWNDVLEGSVLYQMPFYGFIRGFYPHCIPAPTVSRTFTLRVGFVDTIVVTMGAGISDGGDNTAGIFVTAGAGLAVKSTWAGTNAVARVTVTALAEEVPV